MIARAAASAVAAWQPTDEAAVRLCGQFAAYGADHDFLRFFEDEQGNRLSLMEGTATLSASGDTEEMRLLLTMDPTVRVVRTDAETAALLAQAWGVPFTHNAVMTAPPVSAPPSAVQPLSLREVYPLLQAGFGEALPPFEAWYADAHHRLRRGLCRVVGVREGDVPLACAMTVAQSETAALIGAVTTLPAARGRGYASACVTALSFALQQEGKRVLLSPKNDRAKTIYAHSGFTVCGEWGSVTR